MGSITFIENLARTLGSLFEVQFDNEGTAGIKGDWENSEFGIRGYVNNEIIIGLLVKNNTRRLYSGRDSFIIRVLIGLNKPYSPICNF